MNRQGWVQQIRILLSASLPALLILPYNNCSPTHQEPVVLSSEQSNALILEGLKIAKDRIFSSKCASCHNVDTVDSDLKAFDTETLVDGGFVVLGSPQTSPLYLRVVDQTMPPEGNEPLSFDEVTALRDWMVLEGNVTNDLIGGTPIDGGGGGATRPATFTQVREILRQNCTNCHSGQRAPRLDGDANSLINSSFVAPNGQRLVVSRNPNMSRLLTVLSTMPDGDPLGLSSQEANTIRNWINSGAPTQ